MCIFAVHVFRTVYNFFCWSIISFLLLFFIKLTWINCIAQEFPLIKYSKGDSVWEFRLRHACIHINLIYWFLSYFFYICSCKKEKKILQKTEVKFDSIVATYNSYETDRKSQSKTTSTEHPGLGRQRKKARVLLISRGRTHRSLLRISRGWRRLLFHITEALKTKQKKQKKWGPAVGPGAICNSRS